MDRSIIALIVSGALTVPMVASMANSEQNRDPQLSVASANTPEKMRAPHAVAPGENTIIGGEITNIDTVRDQFQLNANGQRQMTVRFDERTQVYVDGTRIPLRGLHPDTHASVQTVLDGTSVFAVSVHFLSHAPEGEIQGQVRSYDPGTRMLSVIAAGVISPITVLVPVNTPITRVGQSDLNSIRAEVKDLTKGALISLSFEPVNRGLGIASRIAVLATPGSAFVFNGDLTSLDMHSGSLRLVDPRDHKSYQLFFDPEQILASKDLREGDRVKVAATFDGSRYVVSNIAVN